MPETPQKPNQPQSNEVIRQDVNRTSEVAKEKNTSSSVSIVTFIILIVGAIIGFFVGGSVSTYLGQRGYLGDPSLAGAYYMLIPVPIFAALTLFAYRGIRSSYGSRRRYGYVLLFIITLSIVLSFLLTYLDYNERQDEIAAIPSKVDFQIYKPSQGHPFNNLSESHLPINENLDIRCRGVEYTYYGNTLGPSLVEMKADEYNCPEFEYINREKYDDALRAAKENTTFDKDKTVISKKVDGDTVLLVTAHSNDKNWIWYIYGVKGDTLISIRVGKCVSGTDCEDKYLEFYRSLEPLTSE